MRGFERRSNRISVLHVCRSRPGTDHRHAPALDRRDLGAIGLDAAAEHEGKLLKYATEIIGSIPGVRLIGTAAERAGVLSFVLEGAHPHDSSGRCHP